MRRAGIAMSVVLLAIGLAPAAGAHPGHPRPRITVMRWLDAPVTAVAEPCEPPDCPEELLVIRAHDPNASVTEVQVWFGEGAPFVYAHTGCVQGTEPGTPARVVVGVSYPAPGTYTVQAVAYSHEGCEGHERGDGHRLYHSNVVSLVTEVEPAA